MTLVTLALLIDCFSRELLGWHLSQQCEIGIPALW